MVEKYEWKAYSQIFERELHNCTMSLDQWYELQEPPREVVIKIQELCKVIYPVKTNSAPVLEIILEHSLISSIQAQVMYINYNLDVYEIITNAVYEVFSRIGKSKIFKIVEEEQCIAWYAAKKIQKHWRECISNPNYLVCRKRLLWEFSELVQK
jgi:hypothetical protein